MPTKKESLEILDQEPKEEDSESDELQLELHKEEKDTKPPMPISKLVLVFTIIAIVCIGIVIGIAAIVYYATSLYTFSYWIVTFLMLMGGVAVIGGGISGLWGGQRTLPIRIVSPSDASVIGKGVLVCGYTIENCLDNEVELTFYDKNKEILYQELLPVDENGIFSIKVTEDFSTKKTLNLVAEAWMVSLKTKILKFILSQEKLGEYNIHSKGLQIGKLHFFPRIYRDFSDKAKIIFDPKRIEKGVIENVQINEGRTTNVFFPGKSSEGEYVPFSTERISKMRLNALYFDIKRSRRILYSLILFAMALAFFVYPIISIFI